MAHISLVLPFALPVPEFAPDLIRALDAPALAALLSRHARQRHQRLDGDARVLPHELWLARALGLAQGLAPGFGARAMRGYGLEPGDGTWFLVNPAHIQIARTHLMMADVRQLALPEDDARALFDAALPCFAEAGHALAYGDADTWFMRADDWAGMRTASPDAVVGMNLTDWMPTGPQARAFRKLQNEVQVNWFAHPVNAARESRGQAPVNTFWPWGGAASTAAHGAAPALAAIEVPGWLGALAGRRLDTLEGVVDGALRAEGKLVIACGSVAAPAIAADWAGWLAQMRRLEAELFAPLHAAVAGGRIQRLRLVLSHRDGHLDTLTTPMAQRKFWRRPTLEALT